MGRTGPDWRRYWHLYRLLVGRELKVKYRGSFLGYLWSMLNPLLFMFIITFVFRRLMGGVENYEVYVLTGILFWNLTATGMIGSTHSLIANAGLLRKVRVPYFIFVLVPIGAAAANFVLALVPYTIIILAKGVPIPSQIVLVPFLIVCYAAFLAGVGIVLATANVYFRDVGHVLEPLLQLCFYATPIIYDRRNPNIPEWAGHMLNFNPLTHFVDLFRATLFSSQFFSPVSLVVVAACGAASLGLGAFVYKRFRAGLSFRL